jgi:hypothetical protein
VDFAGATVTQRLKFDILKTVFSMGLFSQRKGLKPLEKAIQRDSLDEETRNQPRNNYFLLRICIRG